MTKKKTVTASKRPDGPPLTVEEENAFNRFVAERAMAGLPATVEALRAIAGEHAAKKQSRRRHGGGG